MRNPRDLLPKAARQGQAGEGELLQADSEEDGMDPNIASFLQPLSLRRVLLPMADSQGRRAHPCP